MKPHHIPRNRWTVALLILFIIVQQSATLQADTGHSLYVGKFSAESPAEAPPSGWELFTFQKIEKLTRYTLVKDDGVVAVKAESSDSASGLIRKIRIDPEEYPILTWRWKVADTNKKSDITQKKGDDCPARLYITFEYDPSRLSVLEKAKHSAAKLFYGAHSPYEAIAYIWDSKSPAGTVVSNPYTARVMMIVVESGNARLNTWVQEERNILEDYRKAFEGKPPMISGVAIMTDTDNTKESAVSYYGDIVFKKK
jgi:hypothetical protein